MIDTHAHLHLIDRPLKDVLMDSMNAGVQHIIQVAIDLPSIHQNLCEYSHLPNCSITGGIHPLSVTEDVDLPHLLRLLAEHVHQFVAIGEIGLDYKYGRHNSELQKKFFMAQLDFARDHEKPVIIHSRYSDEDMLNIVNQYPQVKKVFHCFATNYAFFEALLGDLNFVSFTGMITYSKKGKIMNALKQVPLDRVMLETDAPYLLPQGIVSKQNSPQYIGCVAHHIAKHRGISIQSVIDQTTKNAQSFFMLPS